MYPVFDKLRRHLTAHIYFLKITTTNNNKHNTTKIKNIKNRYMYVTLIVYLVNANFTCEFWPKKKQPKPTQADIIT